MQQADDPPFLTVGTEVSAKYKGAFCEAKVRKVVRNIKCKVAYKQGGSGTISDEQIKNGLLRVGATVDVKHPDKKDNVEATITKIQDCSQYTVVFDDGDITTLRRSALCLKSGRHFNESETLDQLPLTHPEHFGNPVIGGRRGRRQLQEDSSDEEDDQEEKPIKQEKEEHIGKVVCVENTETKKKYQKENWFPGLVVAPTAQDTVRIRVKDEYLVRSFKDGRYYTVPKKEATEFTREQAKKQDNAAVQAALEYLDNDTLPPHWDRDTLFGLSVSSSEYEQDLDSDSSDDEPREEKDHFVAQLYKHMDDRGTPLNKGPSIVNKDIDLYRLFRAAQKLGGYNRVTSQNQWKAIAVRLGFQPTNSITNLVKQAYKKFLQPFEDFNRKLGCTMVAHPRANRIKGRSLLRANSVASPKPSDQKDMKSANSSTATEEYENTSESSSEPQKSKNVRKLSTGSIGKLKDNIKEEPEDEPPPPKPTPKATKAIKTEEPSTSSVITTPVVTGSPIMSRKSIKVEEEPAPSPPPAKKTPKAKGTEERRGRRKKEVSDSEKSEKVEKVVEKAIKKEEPPPVVAITPIPLTPSSSQTSLDDFPVEVGDKLKVYYDEQKVTYEAKVIEVSKQNNAPIFLVHYTGWNTRYDEWVPKERIAENLTSKQKRTKGNVVVKSASTGGAPKFIPTSKRGRGGSRSESQPPRSTTPSSVTSNSSRTKSPATPAQRRTTRMLPNTLRRTSNNTDISSVQTESDTDSDEPVKKPGRPPKVLQDNTNISRKDSKDASSSNPEDEATASKGRDYDLDQIRSELKGFKGLKSPSPDPDQQQSPTSSVHLDHKTSLFVLSDSNTDSNEQKPKNSESSSDSDSSNDEDSQSSAKKTKPPAKLKKEKESEKSLSKLLGTEKKIFSKEASPVEEANKSEAKTEETKPPVTPKAGKVGALKKGLLDKGPKQAEKLTPKAQEAKASKAASTLESKKKEESIESDVYEFKEPEPFEFEAAATTRKPVTGSPQQSISQAPSAPVKEEEKKKKVGRPADPESKAGVKKSKKSPGKAEAPPAEKVKATKKEEIPLKTAIVALDKGPADLFDFLRKSPSFNISNPPPTTEKLPEFTQTITSDSFSPIVDVKTTITNPGQTLGSSTITKASTSIQKTPVISSAFVNTKNDDDQWQSLKMFKNAVEGQDDMDIDETITPKKPLKELEGKLESAFDLKTEAKSSIADKLLKTLNQPQQQIEPPIPQITKTNKDFTEKLEQQSQNLPKILKKDPLKLDIPIIASSSPIISSPEHKLDILELNPPKNNDLSETIQKLKSAINEDSSDSTDSEQRLIIEDESQSSENTPMEKETPEKESPKPWSEDSLGLKKEKPEVEVKTTSISNVTLKEESLSFASKFQESFFAQTSTTTVVTKPVKTEPEPVKVEKGLKMDLTCNESLDDAFVIDKKEPGISSSNVEVVVEKNANLENMSLLCEETIPCSPVATHGVDGTRKIGAAEVKAIEERKLELKTETTKLIQQTPSSSPRDSQSPDDSKSDSEDLKKQETEDRISVKRRRRARKSPDVETMSGQKRRKMASKKTTGNNGGSDSEDNSDPLSISRQLIRRSPKPCQYNFLVQLDPALGSHQKIAILEKKIQELRKTYNMIKADLASIDRRRKKLRRREREIKKNQQQKAAAVCVN